MAVITLVRPPLLVPTWSDSGPLTPPIGPAYLAASLRQAGQLARIVDGLGENPFQVTPLFDDRVMAIGLRSEEIVERIEPDTDLIGVSCMFSQDWPEIRRLIQMVRQRFPEHPDRRRRRAHHRAPGFTLDSTPEVDVCVDRRRRRNDRRAGRRDGARRRSTAIPGLVLAQRRRHAIHRVAHPHSQPRRHSVARLGSRAARQLSRQRARLRRRSRPQHADDRDARLPVPVHVLLESRDVDDAVVRARIRKGARRDPGVPGAVRRDELRLLRPDRDREAKLDHRVHADDSRPEDGVHLAAPERHAVGGDRRRSQPAALRSRAAGT